MANIDVINVENRSAATNLFTKHGIGVHLGINANIGVFCIMVNNMYSVIPMSALKGMIATAGYAMRSMHNMMIPEMKTLKLVMPPIRRPSRLVWATPVPPIPNINPLNKLLTPCPQNTRSCFDIIVVHLSTTLIAIIDSRRLIQNNESPTETTAEFSIIFNGGNV